jgi:hypothetical protein
VAASTSRRTGSAHNKYCWERKLPFQYEPEPKQESPLPQVPGFQLFSGHRGDRLAVEPGGAKEASLGPRQPP